MKLFFGVLLCTVALVVPAVVLAGGGATGFDGVVSSIESRYHAHAVRIPFLGIVSLVSLEATHGGVGNLHVADFENFKSAVDGAELQQLVQEKIGPGWEQMIRETSRHGGGEQTLIYARAEGKRMGLFIVDKDSDELDVVQISVDPDHLNEQIGHYSHHHGEGDSD